MLSFHRQPVKLKLIYNIINNDACSVSIDQLELDIWVFGQPVNLKLNC